MLRKKNHVVRKKNHVVRKLFYVASPFTYRQPRRAGRRGKKRPRRGRKFPRRGRFLPRHLFLVRGGCNFLENHGGLPTCLGGALGMYWAGSRSPLMAAGYLACASCQPPQCADTHAPPAHLLPDRCSVAHFFIYLCSIFFTLLCHLANHMRHAYAARPLCAPHTATPCQHREG